MGSYFVRHEACPRCGSLDNVGVYSDGHEYCFTSNCGYSKPAYQTVQSLIEKNKKDIEPTNDITIPDNLDNRFPYIVQTWLEKYGITEQETKRNGFKWHEASQSLFMPIFGMNCEILAYQLRYFGSSTDKPRFISRGKFNDICHFLPAAPQDSKASSLVLVEDLISAIKVSRHRHAMPLFTSNLSPDRATRIARYFDSITLWLDYDKAQEATKIAKKYNSLFSYVAVVVSMCDPKEYSDEQIRGHLGTS